MHRYLKFQDIDDFDEEENYQGKLVLIEVAKDSVQLQMLVQMYRVKLGKIFINF